MKKYQIIAEKANHSGTSYFGYEVTLADAQETISCLQLACSLDGEFFEIWKVRDCDKNEIVYVC